MLSPKLICLFNLFFSCNLFLPDFYLLSFYQVISRNRFIFFCTCGLQYCIRGCGFYFLLCFGIKATLHIYHVYHFFACHRNPSLGISPCLVIDHAHFRLSGGLCISRIHRPPIIGISRHHLPVFIVKLYVIAVA